VRTRPRRLPEHVTGIRATGRFIVRSCGTLRAVKVYQYPPTLLASFQNIYPYSSTQSMDSRVSGTTSGSVSASHSELGSYRYTFTTNAYSTNCSITPTASSIVEKRVNVVACTVAWFHRVTAPVGATFHLPAQPISVYIPDSMSTLHGTPDNPGPADRAIEDWNAALPSTGTPVKWPRFRSLLPDYGQNRSFETLSANLCLFH